jgi:hypothetical protein
VRFLFGSKAVGITAAPKRQGFLAFLGLGQMADAPEVAKPSFARAAGDAIEMEKSWEVIDYLLTGSSQPGEVPLHLFNREWPIAIDADIGYGKPMLINAADMALFSDALAGLSDADVGTHRSRRISRSKAG